METDFPEKQGTSPAHWFNPCCCPCSAIDACERSNGGCSAKAECRRTMPGNRACVCSAGYTGDGIVCIGEHECGSGVTHRTATAARFPAGHDPPSTPTHKCSLLIPYPLMPKASFPATWQTTHLQQPNLIKNLPLARITPSPAVIHTLLWPSQAKTFSYCTAPPQVWFQK